MYKKNFGTLINLQIDGLIWFFLSKKRVI